MSLGLTAEKLRGVGVETMAVVATPVDRARLYFRFRSPRCPIGADPELTTHRAFGVPGSALTDDLWQAVLARTDSIAREVGLAVPPGGGMEALNRVDGIDLQHYAADRQRHQAQLTGQFLIDPGGVIRWTNIECERDGLAGIDTFPTDDEMLAAARAL